MGKILFRIIEARMPLPRWNGLLIHDNTLVSAGISRKRNAKLDIAILPVQRRKQMFDAKTVKITARPS